MDWRSVPRAITGRHGNAYQQQVPFELFRPIGWPSPPQQRHLELMMCALNGAGSVSDNLPGYWVCRPQIVFVIVIIITGRFGNFTRGWAEAVVVSRCHISLLFYGFLLLHVLLYVRL